MTQTRPKLLDLFSGAGGASMGYHMAGFDVTGADIEDHPSYPFRLVMQDALEADLSGYDAYAASPPCQGYSRTRHQSKSDSLLLIGQVRDRFESTGKPYVIENVEDARWDMKSPVRLCGSSFGLRVRRHRLFEANFDLAGPDCDHGWQNSYKPYRIYVGKSRTGGVGYRESGVQPVYGGNHNVGGDSRFYKSVAMGIDWMSEEDLNEAIPPAYSAYVGRQLLRLV
jgi:DNA (cytosine-5)-methyltransferase 1